MLKHKFTNQATVDSDKIQGAANFLCTAENCLFNSSSGLLFLANYKTITLFLHFSK